MPGKLIGNGCWVGSNVVVNRNLRAGQKVFVKQEHITTG
jgi:acetyltransferase-like isoleucine patch superfamily enzyme